MNNYTDSWVEICNKEFQLHTLKNTYLKMDRSLVINDLKNSLKDSTKLPIVLNFLINLNEDYKKDCFQELVYQSVYGSPSNLGVAKEIIINMDRTWVNNNISSALSTMQNCAEEGYEDYLYRNIASIYVALGIKDKLAEFLIKYCKTSSNDDIREIYLDYISHIQ